MNYKFLHAISAMVVLIGVPTAIPTKIPAPPVAAPIAVAQVPPINPADILQDTRAKLLLLKCISLANINNIILINRKFLIFF
jgi:hypothetical protein